MSSSPLTLAVAPDWRLDDLAAVLAPDLALEPIGHDRLRRRFLDTFDWRLHAAGGRLVLEHGSPGLKLRWLPEDGDPYTAPVRRPPRLATSLPAGHLRETVGPLLEVRALLDLGALLVDRHSARLVAGDGSTAALVHLEEATPLDAAGDPAGDPLHLLRLEPGPGGARALAAVRAAVGDAGRPSDELELAAAVRGRRPGDYRSKPDLPIAPDDPAARALTAILRHLLSVIEVNAPGTIADLDPEFLHDLRVAVRRSRAALGQLKGVLSAEDIAPFIAELKWLGAITGPVRDLDVYQLELGVSNSLLPTDVAAHLRPLERQIRRRRGRARGVLVRGLRSQRFRRFVGGWRGFLEGAGDPVAGPEGGRSIRDVADRRLAKATRRVLKRGRELGEDPPAESLHRLRIDCKKLRYLLEFFGGLYPSEVIQATVRQLKGLQDALGGFNDMVVQRRQLVELAAELMAAPDTPPQTLLAMGRLDVALEQRGEVFRRTFHEVFGAFADSTVQRPLAESVAHGEAPP